MSTATETSRGRVAKASPMNLSFEDWKERVENGLPNYCAEHFTLSDTSEAFQKSLRARYESGQTVQSAVSDAIDSL